jgi:SWI/SNF-related matrix-associated actin-dependent regulator 1 of chromatin subfamily A
MLQLSHRGNVPIWYIEAKHLKDWGLRSPQGFVFEFKVQGSNYFWTSNEDAAYLFYKRHQIASEDVNRWFNDRRKREEYLYDLSYAVTTDKKYKSPDSLLNYFDYQNAGIEYCQLAGNVLLADYMRIGKTVTSVGVINNGDFDKVLITCPKTAKLVWVNHLRDWLIDKKKIQVLSARSEIDYSADIYIVHYDVLHILSDLSKIDFDLIIADEIHKCKSMSARRTKFFFALNGKKKLGLSGTPCVNKPKDLLTVLKWLNPFWEQFYIYKEQFASKNGFLFSLEEVQKVLRSTMMLRRLQEQVFKGEPIDRRIVPLEVPEHVTRLVKAEFVSVQNLAEVRKALGISKVPQVLNHIDVYSSEGEKLVVFAYHRQVIERLSASLGTKAVTIYGGDSDEHRKDAVERFNNDPECTVFIGSIGAASEAINLSTACHIIFAEQDFSNGQMEQAEERCSAFSQDRPVMVEYLAYEGSVDYQILSKLDLKNYRADKVTDMKF